MHTEQQTQFIQHIAEQLRLRITEAGFADAVDRLITLYYLVRDYNPKSWLEMATTVYNWESQYETFTTLQQVNEMVNSLIESINNEEE